MSRTRAAIGAMLCVGILLNACPATASGSGGEPVLDLPSLEARVPETYMLRAAKREVEASRQSELAEEYKAGLDYFYLNQFGPQSSIVIRGLNNVVLRFQQTGGIEAPLLGTSAAQQNAITTAKTQLATAQVNYQNQYRTILANLRRAYIAYWQSGQEAAISQSYYDALAAAVPQARSLVRNGFWTQGAYADFLDTMGRAHAAVVAANDGRREQLARISNAVNLDVRPFTPVEPAFASSCKPAHEETVATAVSIDSDIKRYDSQISEDSEKLKRVNFSSVSAKAFADAGNENDFEVFYLPRGEGYHISAGVTATAPTHARAEDRALKNEYQADIEAATLKERQRRFEVTEAVTVSLALIDSDRTELDQAVRNEEAARETLREAIVRFHYINQSGAKGFTDVQLQRTDFYTAQRATLTAKAKLLTEVNALLQLAPTACGV